MFQHVTANDGIKLAVKLFSFIERHPPKPMTILGIEALGNLQKLLSDIYAKIINIQSQITDELEHHSSSATHIENR